MFTPFFGTDDVLISIISYFPLYAFYRKKPYANFWYSGIYGREREEKRLASDTEGTLFPVLFLFPDFFQNCGDRSGYMLFSVETDVFFAFYLNIRKICDIIHL